MSSFYLGAALLVVIGLLFIVFPWLRKNNEEPVTTLTNKQLIKQRLNELATEQQLGLLSESDRLGAEDELKIALLDEVKTSESNSSNVGIAISLGALICLAVGIGVYKHANQIQSIDQWEMAQQQTSELGQRMIKGDESLNLQDLQTFALGLRTKLVDTPEDATGWMLLGRVSGAINRVDSAIQAFEKSLDYAPNNVGTLSSYAQALLMTGQEQQTLRAKRVLLHILNLEPDNTNAMGILAIVASELGDKSLALINWQKLIAYIPETDPNYAAVNARILQLKTELSNTTEQVAQTEPNSSVASVDATAVSVTININNDLKAKLPENGFLFVFAQESSGKMKMPAAVVKIPLDTLPVVVRLSDNNAMTPTYTLSQLQQAKLVARVSADENGIASAGDFQGELIVSLIAKKTVQGTITIDREL